MSRPAICFVLSSPYVLNAFLLTHIEALADCYDIHICCDTKQSPVSPRLDKRAIVHHFDIRRWISPVHDALTLIKLAAFLRRNRFTAVHSVTPKGGLLGMWAARFAGVPLRTHIFTGQVWVNAKGVRRKMLKAADKAIIGAATNIFADSPSQARFLETEGIAAPESVQVFGDGSICGVDMYRFKIDENRRRRERAKLGYDAKDTVFLFLGRLTVEKGAEDTVVAFSQIASRYPNAKLLLVGPDESGLGQHLDQVSQNFPNQYRRLGLTDDVPSVLDVADVLCLPSYREGFGNVLIEAAAMGKPAIATRIYGITDAVSEGKGALLVAPGDVEAIGAAVVKMIDKTYRIEMGQAAYERAANLFPAERIRDAWLNYYELQFEEFGL